MGKGERKVIGKLQTEVLIRTVVPILFMGIIIVLYASSRYKNTLYEQMKPMLSSIGVSVRTLYDELYEGDYVLVGEEFVSLYKGEHELTGEYGLIDRIAEEADTEITLFYKDARILTTLKDASGARYVATGVNGAIYHDMEEKQEVLYYNVNIDGTEYYACYVPVLHSDGSLIGMIGVARKSEQIQAVVMKALEPIWLITVLCMLVAGFVSVRYTQGLIDGIHLIREFLQRMTSGELSHSMSSKILKRKDEIGDTGRSVVSMQNAVRILVECDPLTTLYNRRYGTAKLKKIQKQAEKSGMPHSVVIGDIDFFKKVNDTYGHEAGDIVLVKVSEQLKKGVAGKGFVSRWGGEEFLIVFDKYGQERALEVMTQILQNIRNMEIVYEGQTIKVTMTFGIVDGRESDNHEELIRQADVKLYYGKKQGRNRIIASEESIEEVKGDVYIAENKKGVLLEEAERHEEEQKHHLEEEEIVRKMSEHLMQDDMENAEPDVNEKQILEIIEKGFEDQSAEEWEEEPGSEQNEETGKQEDVTE